MVFLLISFLRRVFIDEASVSDQSKVIIMLKVPEEILRCRVEARSGHYAKSNLISSQLATLELPESDLDEPNLIVMDGRGPVGEIVNEIIKKIDF